MAPVDHMQGSAWRKLLSQDKASTATESSCDIRVRQNIASYLALSRRLQCEAENILVLTSVQQAMNIISRRAREEDIVFNFEPWSAERTRATFATEGAGARILPSLASDLLDADFSDIHSSGIFLTPSHHYPLSTTMLFDSRVAFAEKADTHSMWVIEDARDAEFLKDQSLPTIYELRRGHRTFHIGTMSSVLMPFFQLAYVVASPDLIGRLAEKRFLFDDVPFATLELASELLETGMFHAATRAARQIAARRCALFYRLAARYGFWWLPELQDRQGLHGILWFSPSGDDILRLRTDLCSLDAQIELVTRKANGGGLEVGLVVGFAATPDHLMETQVTALASLVARARSA